MLRHSRRSLVLFSLLPLLFLGACGGGGGSAPGVPTLYRTTTLTAPDTICPTGGIRIESGLDANGNGALDEAEVVDIDYVCNASGGLNPLVSVTLEFPDEDCPDGGYEVRMGLDHDSDGVLSLQEVTSVLTACQAFSLVSVTPEPPGDRCAHGGLQIDVGTDTDLDGFLALNEIGSTHYNCVRTLCDSDAQCGSGEICYEGWCYDSNEFVCAPPEEDTERPCENTNGYGTCAGVQTCGEGHWGTCSALEPVMERCADSVDNDCDGETDEPDCSYAACSTDEQLQFNECVSWCYYGEPTVCMEDCLYFSGIGDFCREAITSLAECAMNYGGECLFLPMEELIPCLVGGPCEDLILEAFGPESIPPVCTPDQTEACGSDIGECVSGTRTCDEFGHWGPCQGYIGPADYEICDGLDNDCNGLTDENPIEGGVEAFLDGDGDGYGTETILACEGSGFAAQGGDCDDGNPEVYPGAPQVCDRVDADCNGTLDYLEITEGCTLETICGDGWCDPGEDISCPQDCVQALCSPEEVLTFTDCVDTCGSDPFCQMVCAFSLSPGCQGALMELGQCDSIHGCSNSPLPEEMWTCFYNNCRIEFIAVYGSFPQQCTADQTEACGSDVGACVPGTRTCGPNGFWGECTGGIPPAQDEICNDIDDDCDGLVDNNPIDGVEYFFDWDSDGFGSEPIRSCTDIGYPTIGGDCDDGRPDVYPGAPLLCERIDADCNGTLDYLEIPEGCTLDTFCGDGWCDAGEDEWNCMEDCGEPICDDGDACTYDYVDWGLQYCAHEPVVCDDGYACTTESCDSGYGCIFTPNEALCYDGNPDTYDLCGQQSPWTDPVTGCANPPVDVCGNGLLEPPEACDDGNQLPGDGCESDCTPTQVPGCGGLTYEGCCNGDTVLFCNGVNVQTYDCSPGTTCGWVVESGYYDCTDMPDSDPSGTFPRECLITTCGDGLCSPLAGEDALSCPADCDGPVCGNGITEGYEECDDGNGIDFDACTNACQNAFCGDGFCFWQGGDEETSCPQDCAP